MEGLLDDLTDEQREAVTTTVTPLCIIAGAGSGKTRVVTRRIAWQAEAGRIDPRRVLAVTFTRKAALELRARLRRLGLRDGVAAGTFHAVAWAQIRRHCEETDRRPPELLERRGAFIARLATGLDRPAVAEVAAEIGWARARLVAPEGYVEAARAAGRRPATGLTTVAEIYAAYEAAKRRRRLLDFDDLLTACHESLRRDPRFAEVTRWRHRHLLVDEFQDVNPLQFALLRAWMGDDPDLVVVGDPDQAIYGWNGADPDLLRSIDRHLPGIAVVTLRTNFRSTPSILAAAARVLDRTPQPAVRPDGDPPTVTACDDPDDEARQVARRVRARHLPGAPWRRQAVLARTNAQLPVVRAALEASGIPVVSRADRRLLDVPVVAEVVASAGERSRLADLVADAVSRQSAFAPGSVDETDAATPDDGAALAALVDAARDHLSLDPDATVAAFCASLRSDDRTLDHLDAVELATFHAAKGLEWPVVHLIGVEDGLVPVGRTTSRSARDEERRLLHVAMTRAGRELHLSWCRTRRGREREPSPFIRPLLEAPPAPAIGPDEVRATRRDLMGAAPEEASRVGAASPTGHDAGALVRARLVAWRERRARGARISPTAVLSDRALDAIVARRPTDLDQLAEVAGMGPVACATVGAELLELVTG